MARHRRDERRPPGRRRVLTLDALIALDARLPATTFVIVAGCRRDIPAIVGLLRTRRMPSRLPLKFPRTEDSLAASWDRVHWLLAKRDGALVGCLELRRLEGEPDTWEMGSFSQAADNRNPRVPVKLMTAGFRTLLGIGARAAVVEVHRTNDAMWRFLSRLPFVPEGPSPDFPEFLRARMSLQAPR